MDKLALERIAERHCALSMSDPSLPVKPHKWVIAATEEAVSDALAENADDVLEARNEGYDDGYYAGLGAGYTEGYADAEAGCDC